MKIISGLPFLIYKKAITFILGITFLYEDILLLLYDRPRPVYNQQDTFLRCKVYNILRDDFKYLFFLSLVLSIISFPFFSKLVTVFLFIFTLLMKGFVNFCSHERNYYFEKSFAKLMDNYL